MAVFNLNNELEEILKKNLEQTLLEYQKSFSSKVQKELPLSIDILMDVFLLTKKRMLNLANMQYWGTQLGRCWEKLGMKIFSKTCTNYQDGLSFTEKLIEDGKIKKEEVGKVPPAHLCDCVINCYAIDTKWRCYSADAGTLKKFRRYGLILAKLGYKPIVLIVNRDNLQSPITALKSGKWEILIGDNAFDFIKKMTKFDIKTWLISKKGLSPITAASQMKLIQA